MLKTLKELNVRPGDKVRHRLPNSLPGDVYKVTHISNSGQVYADPSLFRLDMTSPYWEVVERHRDRTTKGVEKFMRDMNDLAVQNGYKGIVSLEVQDKDGSSVEWQNRIVTMRFAL